MTNKILKCNIEVGGWGETNKVHVEYEDGSSEVVFSYFADELSFSESELIGLTKKEALELHHNKDVAYLRS